MRSTTNVLLLSSLLGLSTLSFAYTSAEALEMEYKDPGKYPLGCRDQGYEYVLNTLRLQHVPDSNEEGQEEGGQSLFFIYNRTKQVLNLNQMLDDNSTRSTYLNHTMQPNQWSVLATNQAKLKYICSINSKQNSYGKIVNCADSLRVCEYVRVKFGLNNRGNFWVVKNANRGPAVGGVVRYGIIPR